MARRRSTRALSTRPPSRRPSSGGAGREKPPGQRRSGGLRSPPAAGTSRLRISLRIAARPQRALEAALARAGEADAVDLRRRQPFDLEAARRRGRRGASVAPGGPPGGRARRRRARSAPARCGNSRIGPSWAPRAARRRARPAARQQSRRRPGAAGAPGASLVARARGRQAPGRQRGNWSSGRTCSTRDVGGGMSQVTRNTAPPKDEDQEQDQENAVDGRHDSQRRIGGGGEAKGLPRARIAALYRLRAPVSTPGQTSGRIITSDSQSDGSLGPDPPVDPAGRRPHRSCWSA